MNQTRSAASSTRPPAPGIAPDPPGVRPLVLFVAVAAGVGGLLLTLSTLIEPGAPFILAAVLAGLALPALILTHRDTGGEGVRALLRDCLRLPRAWWWLPVAGFALPCLSWATAAVSGGARPLTWPLIGYYIMDLIIGAVVINIWEEMAWTGFAQRRAMARWGTTGGSLVTAALFTGIHVPLAFDGARSAAQVASNVLLIAGVAIGVRLLIGRVDAWTGRSLLTIGVLHSSFNATETILDPDHDWVRIVVTIAVAVVVIASGRRSDPPTAPAACRRRLRAGPAGAPQDDSTSAKTMRTPPVASSKTLGKKAAASAVVTAALAAS
jgi:membrane protease YdiL (CAAX protease family)